MHGTADSMPEWARALIGAAVISILFAGLGIGAALVMGAGH